MIPNRHSPHRGNILFLILLAVVLFAALAYAVTASLRGGGKDASEERAQATAAAITQYGTLVANGLQRFLLVNNLSINQIDLIHPTIPNFTGNNSGDNTACASSTCNLFSPNGGGVTLLGLPEAATDLNAASVGKVGGQAIPSFLAVSVQDVGTTLPDIVITYGSVKSDVCTQFNILNGVQIKGGTYVYDAAGANEVDNKLFATYMPAMGALPINILGDADARIRGKRMFCSQNNSANPAFITTYGNYIYMVIYEQ